ncbi:MAG: ABC transporter permease subunit [Acidobacteriota bacterium]
MRASGSPIDGIAVATTSKQRLWIDRLGRWAVTSGGLVIIVSILAILVFIILEALPLARQASVEPLRQLALPPGAAPVVAMVSDSYRTNVAVLGADGVVRILRAGDGKLLKELQLPSAEGPGVAGGKTSTDRHQLVAISSPPGGQLLTATTDDGRVLLIPVDWQVAFNGAQRIVTLAIGEPVSLPVDPQAHPIGVFTARLDDEAATAAAQLSTGGLVIVRRTTSENLLTGEITEELNTSTAVAPRRLNHLLMDREQRNLYGSTRRGELLWWSLQSGLPGPPQIASAGLSEVTALTLLLGQRSLVVGQADGSLSVWFPVRQQDGSFRLTHIRDSPRHPSAIRLLSPSPRDRGFLALDDSGLLGLYHSTSQRTLWRGVSPLPVPTALSMTPKAGGAFLAGGGRLAPRLALLEIRNPHPEVSLGSLFGKVWYEGHGRPEYVWQSSGGTDEFEPKLSLVPLLLGTLKGTLYSLLLAIPLAVLAAIYSAQFMHPLYRRYIKPTVEIMAALPSVVLGFLAGLWLAPRLEHALPALLLMTAALPISLFIAGTLWRRLSSLLAKPYPDGTEVFFFATVMAAAIWICVELGPSFESIAFGGNFQAWLLQTTGLPFDQRNAVIVGLAMGFAVVPIIFSISEEAFANVPNELVAGSLALGATRWQTASRVVFPTASPAIFSAIMVGFGRAVGETMIMLMATGNTPVLSWNAFNGFRTLSANIAVEIPEAPQYSTLYRVLFLSALLLFVMTSIINTAAEIIRQRLRRRYAQL